MAFSTKIEAKINKTDTKLISIEPSWWNQQELREIYSFTEELSHGYRDYTLKVTPKEFSEILNHQRKYLNKGIYSLKEWIKVNNETILEIDGMLKKTNEHSEITISIFEWSYG